MDQVQVSGTSFITSATAPATNGQALVTDGSGYLPLNGSAVSVQFNDAGTGESVLPSTT